MLHHFDQPFELTWDGMQVKLAISRGRFQLRSRTRRDWIRSSRSSTRVATESDTDAS